MKRWPIVFLCSPHSRHGSKPVSPTLTFLRLPVEQQPRIYSMAVRAMSNHIWLCTPYPYTTGLAGRYIPHHAHLSSLISITREWDPHVHYQTHKSISLEILEIPNREFVIQLPELLYQPVLAATIVEHTLLREISDLEIKLRGYTGSAAKVWQTSLHCYWKNRVNNVWCETEG